MNKWSAELFRFTAFPPETTVTVSPEQWWLTVATEPADNVNVHPKTSQFRFLGNYNEGELSLNINPARLDWLWRAREADEQPEATDEQTEVTDNIMPVLGKFKEKAEAFQQMLNPWFGLDDLPVARRIAIGAVLLQPVSDRPEGYRRLQEYLQPVLQIDPEHSEDLLYQINRPRNIVVGDRNIYMNRLSKWSVAANMVRTISFSPEGTLLQTKAIPQIGVRLELDISTDVEDDGQFDAASQQALLEAMLSVGSQIAVKGDVIENAGL